MKIIEMLCCEITNNTVHCAHWCCFFMFFFSLIFYSTSFTYNDHIVFCLYFTYSVIHFWFHCFIFGLPFNLKMVLLLFIRLIGVCSCVNATNAQYVNARHFTKYIQNDNDLLQTIRYISYLLIVFHLCICFVDIHEWGETSFFMDLFNLFIAYKIQKFLLHL